MCSSSNSSSSFIHLFSNPSTASLITISAVTQNGSNEDNDNDYNNQKGSIMINEVMIITLYLSFCLMFLSFILALYEGYNCTFLKPFLPTTRRYNCTFLKPFLPTTRRQHQHQQQHQ